VLPEKSKLTSFGDRNVDLRYGARLDFDATSGDVLTINETTYVKVNNASDAIGTYIKTQVGQLPDDQCGSQASLAEIGVRTYAGLLTVTIPLRAEQWGCAFGVRAQLASGRLTFTASFRPSVQNGKLKLTPSVSHTGNLVSTVPDIDTGVTSQIQTQIESATSDVVRAVRDTVEGVQKTLDEMQAQANDPTTVLKPLYDPKVMSVGFNMNGGALVLTQARTAQAREGTACKIRGIAPAKWIELN
jgi:hypothetical protein